MRKLPFLAFLLPCLCVAAPNRITDLVNTILTVTGSAVLPSGTTIGSQSPVLVDGLGGVVVQDMTVTGALSATITGLDAKADKVSGAVAGDFAGLDASGNLTDSRSKAADFDAAGAASTAQTNAEGYADLAVSTQAAAQAATDATQDGRIDAVETTAAAHEASITGLTGDLADKADKVSAAVNGNLAGLDAGGNLTDSGIAAGDVISDGASIAALTVTELTATGNITAADVVISALPVEATPASGMKLIIDYAGTREQIDWNQLPGAGGGEANTASNLGSGEGVYAQKIGVDLQFKSIAAGAGMTLASSATEITLTSTATGLDATGAASGDVPTADGAGDWTWTAGGSSTVPDTVAVTTATRAVLATETGYTFTNTGAGAGVLFSLPAVADKLTYTFFQAQQATGGIDTTAVLGCHFDGANDGTTFPDSSISAHTVSQVGGAVTKTGTKKFGTASVYFDGTDDGLDSADSADWNFGADPFTVDFWINLTEAPANYDTIISQHTSSNGSWALDFSAAAPKLRFVVVNTSNTTIASYTTSAAPTLNTGTWYHIALVRNGSSVYIFLDGVSLGLDVATAISTTAMPDVAASLNIGYRTSYSRTIPGYLDELRISKGTARWTSAFTPPTAAYGSSVVSVDPNGTNQIMGITDAGGDKITQGDIGRTIKLYSDGSAWYSVGGYGTWTDGN